MTQGISLMYSYPTDTINGWTVPNMATGNFSSDYYLRAYIALVLYAANVPQDAVYYNSDLFPSGEDLTYLIEFSPTTSGPATSGPPPTNEFWSITMYTEAGYLVPNEQEKYSISSQQELSYEPDGSLRIIISVHEPTAAEGTKINWLPAPQNGEKFVLTLRIYWPQEQVLSGDWSPPPVQLLD
jgi:hypothetical protein